MVKFISRVSGNTGRFLALATVATVLTACGGSSGDSTPGVFVDDDGDDLDDNTGLTVGDFLAVNGGTFTDSDSDGIDDNTGLTEAEFLAAIQPPVVVEGDEDGDGFTDVSVATPCGSEAGTINDASTPAWNANCVVQRNGQFANSRFTVGIQRIVYCSGFGDASSYEAFADGAFGPNTEAAVREFQAADLSGAVAGADNEGALDPIGNDGRVGPQTWAKLQARIELLNPGPYNDESVAQNAYGFSTGRCAGIHMFYQSVTLNTDSISNTLGGWTLARNRPNEAESIKFSKDPVGGL